VPPLPLAAGRVAVLLFVEEAGAAAGGGDLGGVSQGGEGEGWVRAALPCLGEREREGPAGAVTWSKGGARELSPVLGAVGGRPCELGGSRWNVGSGWGERLSVEEVERP
jgi:hypothetical protein